MAAAIKFFKELSQWMVQEMNMVQSLAEDYNPLFIRWLVIATAVDAPNKVCFFYNLLNMVLSFEPSNSVMMSADTATHLKLIEASLKDLLVLINSRIPG